MQRNIMQEKKDNATPETAAPSSTRNSAVGAVNVQCWLNAPAVESCLAENKAPNTSRQIISCAR